jgi:hypothetical protein
MVTEIDIFSPGHRRGGIYIYICQYVMLDLRQRGAVGRDHAGVISR